MSLLNSTELQSVAADEQHNQSQMDAQFTRFTLVMNELKKQLAECEKAHREQSAIDPASPALAPLLQQSYLLFLELKSISRSLTNMSETTKSQISYRKKRLDTINLQSESILYEKSHFQKEIAIAQDFHSKYTTPDLVTEEEFARSHAIPTSTMTPHQLWMARLQDERERRAVLLSQQQMIEASNAELLRTNDEMRDRKKAFNEALKRVYTQLKESESEYFPPETKSEKK